MKPPTLSTSLTQGANDLNAVSVARDVALQAHRDDVAERRVHLKCPDQHNVIDRSLERLEVMPRPAVVLRYHDPGDSEPTGVVHHLLRHQPTVWAALVGVDVQIK